MKVESFLGSRYSSHGTRRADWERTGHPMSRTGAGCFLGRGGRYGAAELHARASMLEALEASIRVLYEQLEVLMREITEQTANVS